MTVSPRPVSLDGRLPFVVLTILPSMSSSCPVRIFDGLFAKGHPAETREKLASIIAEYSPFKLAGTSTFLSQSFLLLLRSI